MYRLYGNSGMANLAPHMPLEAIGTPYEMVLVGTAAKEHQGAAYLRLNPTGRGRCCWMGTSPSLKRRPCCAHRCPARRRPGV